MGVLAVPAILWQLIRLFAQAYSCDDGASCWHIFEESPADLRICLTPPLLNATIHPVFHHRSLTAGFVGLMYVYPDQNLTLFEGKKKTDWKEQIGPEGF